MRILGLPGGGHRGRRNGRVVVGLARAKNRQRGLLRPPLTVAIRRRVGQGHLKRGKGEKGKRGKAPLSPLFRPPDDVALGCRVELAGHNSPGATFSDVA